MATSLPLARTDTPSGPLTRRTQRRFLLAGAGMFLAMGMINTASSLWYARTHPGMQVTPAVVVTVLLVACGSAVAYRLRRYGVLTRWPGYVALAAVLFSMVMTTRWVDATYRGPYWTLAYVMAAVTFSPLILGVGGGAIYSCAVLGALGAILHIHNDLLTSVLSASSYAVASVAFLLVVAISDQVVQAGRQLSREVAIADELVARERQHQDATAWWRALLHDRFLAALLVGRRATTPDSRRLATSLAREALRSATNEPLRTFNDVPNELRALAQQRGLNLATGVRVARGAPVVVSEAVSRALYEAMRNTCRHAGVSEARLTGVVSPTMVDLRWTDEGRGFDPAARTDGHGVSSSIVEAMEQVGGAAELTSSPGRGTTVRLVWELPRAMDTIDSWWRVTWVRLLIGVLVLNWFVHVLTGMLTQHVATIEWWWALQGVLIVGLTVPAWLERISLLQLRLCWAAAVGVMLLQTAVVPLADHADYRYWYVGAWGSLVVSLPFRRMARETVVGTLVAVAGGIGIMWVRQPSAVGSIAAYLVTLPVFAVLGAVIAREVKRTTDAAAVVARRQWEDRLALDLLRQRAETRAARLGTLHEDVLPLLQRMADEDWDDAMPEECRRLELATRDLLVAAPLMTPAIVMAVSEARERGVTVDAVVEGDEDAAVEDDRLASLRGCVAKLLPQVPDTAAMRVRVNLTQDNPTMTVAVTELQPADAGRLAGVARAATPLLGTIDIVEDEEAVVLMFDPSGQVRETSHADGSGEVLSRQSVS